MKYYALMLVIGILLSSHAVLSQSQKENTAEFEITSYQINSSINITSTCFLNGQPCPATIICNINSYYPDLSVMISNKQMTFLTGGIYNYTVANNTLNSTGEYKSFITCSDPTNPSLNPSSTDMSFRVVNKVLYKGGGFITWQIALSLGLIGLAFVFAILTVFTKTFWMRSLFMFGALLTMITSGNLFLQIAELEGQILVGESLSGFYIMVVIFAILVLGLFIINFFWDIADIFGKLPRWSKKVGRRKPQLEE